MSTKLQHLIGHGFDVAALKQRHELSLYVHYPYCIRKCPYCDFSSFVSLQNDSERDSHYLDLLIREFELKLQYQFETAPEFVSVYIGGGTPSLCAITELQRLLNVVEPYLSANAEISLEANPGTVDFQKFSDLRAIGFNRLSLGVQSFNDAALKRLGRIHNASEAIEACRMARKAGFDNFNIDLMHGLPKQSVSEGLFDLETACSLGSTHLSWYELTIEEDTYFGRNPPKLPSEEILSEIEEHGFAYLKQQGFERYEVSGFNLQGRYPCRHNLNYWLFGDYLGIGAGAHQKLTRDGDFTVWRSNNPQQPQEYADSVLKAAVLEQHEVGRDELPFEYMLNRLRLTDGVCSAQEYKLHTGLSWEGVESRLPELQQQGLIEITTQGFLLTSQGKFLLNDVITAFL